MNVKLFMVNILRSFLVHLLMELVIDSGDLMQGLLEGVSHSFTKNFHFIDSVKAYLSYALLRASVSQSPVIFQVYFDLHTFLALETS